MHFRGDFMRYFDLHCDTMGECCKRKLPLFNNSELHISLDKAMCLEGYTQLFAIWIPDEFRGDEAVSYFDKVSSYFYKELEKNKEYISLAGSGDKTKLKAVLTVEGGSASRGTVEGVKHLYDKGVRVMTLTWNAVNEIASGAFSEGGLTENGKEVISEMERLGMVVDVSHLNRKSFFDVAEFAEKPFIASHSNADIVENFAARKRNLTDEQIGVIRDGGGLIGLNFCEDFLRFNSSTGIDALLEQIKHFLGLGCENILSIGSDYDGCPVNSDFNGVEKIPDVFNALIKKGISEKTLEKIFYLNAESFFNLYL